MSTISSATRSTIGRTWKPYIDGEFVSADSTELIQVENPATGEPLTEVESASPSLVGKAIAAASKAFDDWRWLSNERRGDVLERMADELEAHATELAEIETLENGKPIDQSRRDVSTAVKRFRFYAGGIDKFYSDSVTHSPEKVQKKVYEPYGVVGVIIPWNWPPMHFGDFVSVALAAGNTVVLKPSPYTPLTELRMMEILSDSVPDGVLNVIPGGVDAGVELTSHADVDMVSFTGSDANGGKVLKQTAEQITPTMLELGGKNPAIVFPDADLADAVPTLIANTFNNGGQACSCPERLYLHEDIYDEFIVDFKDRVQELVVGNGMNPETQVGPMATQAQVEKITDHVELALSEGASILAQADQPSDQHLSNGFWVSPTVLTDVSHDMRIVDEEVFGPVLSVLPFESEDEVIRMANDSKYGLTGTVWTENLQRAHRLSAELEAGVVGINNPTIPGLELPFGGYKRSGIGRKTDFNEAMRQFSQVKSIQTNLTTNDFRL